MRRCSQNRFSKIIPHASGALNSKYIARFISFTHREPTVEMQIHALEKTRVSRRNKIKMWIKFSQEFPLRANRSGNKGVRPPGSRKLISARAGDSVNRARRNRRSSGSTHRVESYGARFFIRNRHSTSNRWITTFSRGPRGSEGRTSEERVGP